MIEINLLPKEFRRRRGKIELLNVFPKIKFMPLVIGIGALIIAIQLILTVSLVIKKATLKKLESKWVELEPQKEVLSVIRKQVKSLNTRIKDIEALRAKRIVWAKKLNDLSDSIMPGIWLTSLSLEEKIGRKYLSIKGSASSFGREEAAMIGRFIKALKDNDSFFEDFEEIKLGTMQQRIVKEIEVMDFSIDCYLKAEK